MGKIYKGPLEIMAEIEKDVREKEKENRENKKNRKKKIEEELNEKFGKTQITKEDPNSLVCDGAKLHCTSEVLETSNFQYSTVSAPYIGNNIPSKYPYTTQLQKKEMIDFKISKSNGYLMGVDPLATIEYKLPENFEPKPHLNCKKGGKCKIKEYVEEWSEYSQNLIVNGYNALLKKSVLKCGYDKEAEITIVDNE